MYPPPLPSSGIVCDSVDDQHMSRQSNPTPAGVAMAAKVTFLIGGDMSFLLCMGIGAAFYDEKLRIKFIVVSKMTFGD